MDTGMTIDEMTAKLQVELESQYKRVISQALTLLQEKRALPQLPEKTKKFQREDGKWQVYKIKSYPEHLYYDFQQLCIILDVI